MEVFCSSPWVPAEWIKAHGLDPRGIGGVPGLKLEAYAAGVCPFAQGVVDSAATNRNCAFVFTTHCDQLRRGFDVASPANEPRTFLFNLPATWQGSAAPVLFASELARLSKFLMQLGGIAPSVEILQEWSKRYHARRWQLLEAAGQFHDRCYAGMVYHFQSDGPGVGTNCLPGPRMVPHPQRFDLRRRVPLAVIGGPLPSSQWPVLDLVEQAGGSVVLNATDDGERGLNVGNWEGDFSDLPSFASAHLARCVDVWQRPNSRLYAWLQERLGPRGVRGIVLWYYPGCDLWRGEAQSLREAFKLPVLAVEGGDLQSLAPRIQGRIEALLESLR